MSIDANNKKRIISNFDGLNLTPTFFDEQTVLTLTKNGKSRLYKYVFDYAQKRGKFFLLDNEDHQSVTPTFIDENRILFCPIDDSCNARIAIFNIKENKVDYLTQNGCMSPAYNKKTDKVAYCKRVDGIYQIFICDLQTKEHKQLTSDTGDKDGCTFSDCGNYLAFSVENSNKSRIAILNLLTEKYKLITPEIENWSSPSWSPIYEEIPFFN